MNGKQNALRQILLAVHLALTGGGVIVYTLVTRGFS